MLIAEIGNNHFGSMDDAKELIRVAIESGADLVKGQAFLPKDLIPIGSMPADFYHLTSMTPLEYMELIQYARSLGKDMFFSIFSSGFDLISDFQRYGKVAGSQTKRMIQTGASLSHVDKPHYFISIPDDCDLPRISHAYPLYVSPYMHTNPSLETIRKMIIFYNGSTGIGYSCHSPGTESCARAISNYGVRVIEKHFTLKKNLDYAGKVFRDTVHAADPKELEKIANLLRGK